VISALQESAVEASQKKVLNAAAVVPDPSCGLLWTHGVRLIVMVEVLSDKLYAKPVFMRLSEASWRNAEIYLSSVIGERPTSDWAAKRQSRVDCLCAGGT
jgi:hypothetical protein